MHLPITGIIPDIKKQLHEKNTIIVQAPPGAGKSTLLPLELLNEPWLKGKKILMLEPRRLAARAVANRMSFLLNEEVGNTVGYRIRFENRTGKNTRIEVLTEGILTRMLQQDNSLENTGLVIFDEFHERSLHADLALALCREAQQVIREDLRIMIMSATLDGSKLSALLGNAPILTSEGRQHPITINYIPQERDARIPVEISKAVRKSYAAHPGDILCFLPGAGEIRRTQEILEAELSGAMICPLYGDLSQQKQQEAILPDPNGNRKIVLATSIAETSLTIEGIQVVVDSGYSRVPRFDPGTGLTRLETIRVTKDTADQRAGRAGRLGPGICYRLWSEGSNHHLVEHHTPEILEADLAPAVLELAQWGKQDINALTWLTPPPAGAVNQAKELLNQLEAMKGGRSTERGKQMLRFPTHPRIAHLLIEGKSFKLSSLAADVAALLEERDPLPKEAGANLALRVEALRRWRSKEYIPANRNAFERIERSASVWRKMLDTEIDNAMPVDSDVGKLLATAYPERIAKRIDKSHRYRLSNGHIAKLQDHDPLASEEWLVVAHLDAGTNEGRIYLAAPLNPEDVMHLAAQNETVTWDSQKGILIAQKESRIGNIILKSTPLAKIPEEQQTNAVCGAVRSEGLNILPWTDEITSWQSRLMSLRNWRPTEGFPDISHEQLLNSLEEWLAPFLQNIKKRDDFKKVDLQSALSNLLSWEQRQKMDSLSPEKIKVPSGSEIHLQYFPDGSAPVLAVRLQEVFGLIDTPTVNEGRTKVLMHLLSPGYKPVQVTQDLRSFWKNTYHEVRKELRVRYQKHHWPEDPWTAKAVRGAKKRS